jgi:membrane protease YdiL (CAAX protease family)
MKTQRLSENEVKKPDFATAVKIIFLMFGFSLFVSFVSARIDAISSDTAFSLVWGIFNTLVVMFAVLWYAFRKFGMHIFSLLKKPPGVFLKGFYVYAIFFPGLLAVTALSFAFFKIFGLNPVPQQVMSLYLKTDSFYLLFLLFFSSCIAAPFAEEVIFRGVIYPALKERFPVPAAVLLSSAIFALMHNEAFVFAGLFAFGILLAYLFEKHQNLWLPISVHFFNNLFANAAVFIIKYTDVIKTLEG